MGQPNNSENFNQDIMPFKILSKRAQNQGKIGSSMFADIGLFSLYVHY